MPSRGAGVSVLSSYSSILVHSIAIANGIQDIGQET